jgi:hypothetical protein
MVRCINVKKSDLLRRVIVVCRVRPSGGNERDFMTGVRWLEGKAMANYP